MVELVDARLTAFAERYAATYPAAMKILLTDREDLTAYLRFPAEHHRRIRHSNFIERTFGETRRRAKVIGRFPGETSCLGLVWAVGRAGPRLPRLARPDHDPCGPSPAPRPAGLPARITSPALAPTRHTAPPG
jgi:hypothetical protein